MAPKKLWKTTIVIWSDEDPGKTELEDLAREAVSGGAYCSLRIAEEVDDPSKDPQWDGNEFFDEYPDISDEPEEDDEPIHNIDSNNKWGSQ